MKVVSVFKLRALKVVMLAISLTLLAASASAQKNPIDVNVLNTPTVNLSGTPSVNVQSLPTVVIRDPEAGHESWHASLRKGDTYTVSAGKMLVIEYVNGIAQLGTSDQPDWTLSVEETGVPVQGYHFAGQSFAGCTNCYVMSEQVRIYAPTGTVVTPGFVPVGSALRLSGYLITL